MTTQRPIQKQCTHCPWKVTTVPDQDIPGGYCQTKHKRLKETVAEQALFRPGDNIKVMACHEAPVGKEKMCAGWAMNQLGAGNNLGLRLRAMSDPTFPHFELDGEQHPRFEDTLP